jgi:hypothetical protein|tara:strand:- start:185 stop:565 length:381 start_codon:yes stop_codon:yes gene_type:complete
MKSKNKPTFILYKSNRPSKKYVLDTGTKRVYFGSSKYRDFTLMNDEKSKFYEPNEIERLRVKKNYLKRHMNDNLDDPTSPGSLSYFLLWSEETLPEAIEKYPFKVKIIDNSNEVYDKTFKNILKEN